MNNLLIFSLLAVGIFIFKKVKAEKMDFSSSEPRGIRNNNPLNIEFNINNNWLGQVGSDGRFCQFTDPIYGIRAGAILIKNYINLYGLNTIESIINRFAPSHENPVNNYINYVAGYVEKGQHDVIYFDDFPKLITAMIYFENGKQPYSEYQINEALRLANI